MSRVVHVKIETAADVINARLHARKLAMQAGFSLCESTIITTAISEITRNILEYATCGEVFMTLLRNGKRCGVKIVASDQGPGIADIRLVMQDGYSSREGLGIGLPGTRRLMDEFEIKSKIGDGTVVTMKKWNHA